MTIREHFLTVKDSDLWQTYLPGVKSVFGSLGYAQIAEHFLGRTARLYVVESDHGWIAHPMLLRPLSALPFAGCTSAKWDAGTPEYTGPRVFGDGEGLGEEYSQRRTNLAYREGIVSEFAHLDPWSDGDMLLGEGRIYDRDIIWVDTTLGLDTIWTDQLEGRARTSIKKGTREGLHTEAASNEEEVREFVRVYWGTMNRTGALAIYSFPYEYFLAYRDQLGENARVVITRYGDRVIGGQLIIHDDHHAYVHLAASDAAFYHLNPAAFQYWHAIQWAHESGKTRLVLGGGYRPNDGVFKFKASFSHLRQPFYVYKKIHLAEEYARLDRRSRAYNNLTDEEIEYFPSYRYVKS